MIIAYTTVKGVSFKGVYKDCEKGYYEELI